MFDLNALTRKNILDLKPYSSARSEFNGEADAWLDANENPFSSHYNRYPDPSQKQLSQAVADCYQTDPQNLLLCNGSDQGIDLLFRAFCEPKEDKIMILTPTYGMYKVSAAINDIETINVPLNKDFQPQINLIEPYLEDPKLKMIFICSPNNPTGNLINQEAINYLLKNFKGLVILDEAYMDFSPTESYLPNLNSFPNLVILKTFSKAWGLAGVRIGMTFANPPILAVLNKIRPPYNISILIQRFLLDFLKDKEQVKENVSDLNGNKSKLIKELSSFDFVKKIYPSQANFVLVEVEDAPLLYNYLVGHRIIVRNRTNEIANTLRISIGTHNELNQLFKKLKQFQDEKNPIY